MKEETSTREGEMISKNIPAVHNANDERQPKTHQHNQKNLIELKELPKEWRQYKSLKKLSSKLSGISQFNPSRYKLIFFRKKGAYSESFSCKRKQMNWEYA